MKIVVIGGTGLIASKLVEKLARMATSRSPRPPRRTLCGKCGTSAIRSSEL
jgi:nucleoside-diphosphate-sugar epimerase